MLTSAQDIKSNRLITVQDGPSKKLQTSPFKYIEYTYIHTLTCEEEKDKDSANNGMQSF